MEWIVNIMMRTVQLLPDAEGYTCNTYNTADNVADKMWGENEYGKYNLGNSRKSKL